MDFKADSIVDAPSFIEQHCLAFQTPIKCRLKLTVTLGLCSLYSTSHSHFIHQQGLIPFVLLQANCVRPNYTTRTSPSAGKDVSAHFCSYTTTYWIFQPNSCITKLQ